MASVHLHVNPGTLAYAETYARTIDTRTRAVDDLPLQEGVPCPVEVAEGALVTMRVTGRVADRESVCTLVLRAEAGASFQWESGASHAQLWGEGAQLLAHFEAGPHAQAGQADDPLILPS